MAVNIRKLVTQVLGMFLVMALTLFLAAGTWLWPAGWTFLILFFGFVVALTLWLLKHNPGLLTERMTITRSDQKGWDKIFLVLAFLVFYTWLALMPLDAVRFQWSNMPTWLQLAGELILVASFYLFFLTFRENSYLSPMVRIQTDRGHQVVTTGPYHYVRHPMYSGALLFIVGTSLLLGSWVGLIYGLLLIAIVARRAVLEERTLQQELPGYDTYMAQVNYRLIPRVW